MKDLKKRIEELEKKIEYLEKTNHCHNCTVIYRNNPERCQRCGRLMPCNQIHYIV